MKKILIVILTLTMVACSDKKETDYKAKGDGSPVKNVIFLIGDGMGLAQVSKAVSYTHLRDPRDLSTSRMPSSA